MEPRPSMGVQLAFYTLQHPSMSTTLHKYKMFCILLAIGKKFIHIRWSHNQQLVWTNFCWENMILIDGSNMFKCQRKAFWIFVTKWSLLFSKHDTKYWKMILVEIKVLWYQKNVQSIGDTIWIQKNVVYRIMNFFLVGHIVLKDVIDTKPTKIEKVKNLPCPKTRKTIGNMFETSGFPSKLHQKLCNPTIRSHKKIQTYMECKLWKRGRWLKLW